MGIAMLELSGKLEPIKVREAEQIELFVVSKSADIPGPLRRKYVYCGPSVPGLTGFGAYILKDQNTIPGDGNVYRYDDWCHYFCNSDVIRIDANKNSLRSLYRSNSNSTSILLTERCNHYCLMCSQPPREKDDSVLMDEAFNLIRLLPRDIQDLGLTGGEPTLYGKRLIELVDHIKVYLPNTPLDILTNGRAFAKEEYAQLMAGVEHPNLMIAVPVYSSNPEVHDYVVQASGAFDETIRGIINLKRYDQQVQIRVVLHKQTIPTLVELARFIAFNLRFVDEVALMGMEIKGFTKPNLTKLWMDPYEYKDILAEAVSILDDYGIRTKIFNHQLCVINPVVEKFCVRSISDWKNDYLDECDKCFRRGVCGAFSLPMSNSDTVII